MQGNNLETTSIQDSSRRSRGAKWAVVSWTGSRKVSVCSPHFNGGVQEERDMVFCFGQKKKNEIKIINQLNSFKIPVSNGNHHLANSFVCPGKFTSIVLTSI